MAVPNDYPNFKDIKNEKLRRICYILDTGNIEGLCMPEYEELTNYLRKVDSMVRDAITLRENLLVDECLMSDMKAQLNDLGDDTDWKELGGLVQDYIKTAMKEDK